MPISALPEQCKRLLGSSSVIATPGCLVKELVENSIDAHSSSIDVLISANTVDRIEVRDNGTGIPTDDFSGLGRRGYTSKLTSLVELRDASFSTLGFRGEALASLSCLGTVRITTRTESDQVASIIQLVQGGEGIANKELSSALVGTTVLVTDLFDRLPVRKRISISESQKTVAQIKTLMLSYILSKPDLKLSLRVLKTQAPLWTYSPRPGAGIREAILQGFGAELANQCQWKSAAFDIPAKLNTSLRDTSSLETGLQRFSFDAFLPNPAADFSKACKGAYISVNSRPLSPARGTGKKLFSVFRMVVERSRSLFDHHVSKNPFLVLNIKCPATAFDVTIEPSKQDILFMHEQALMDEFERFCRGIYENPDTGQEVGKIPMTCQLSEQQKIPAGPQEMGTGIKSPRQSCLTTTADQISPASSVRTISMDRSSTRDAMRSSASPSTETHHVGQSGNGAIDTESSAKRASTNLSRSWAVDMSAAIDLSSDEEDHDNLEIRRSPHIISEDSNTDEPNTSLLGGLNPWTIAKLNAPQRKEICRDVPGGGALRPVAAGWQLGADKQAIPSGPEGSGSIPLGETAVAHSSSIIDPSRPETSNPRQSQASGDSDHSSGTLSPQGASLHLDKMAAETRVGRQIPSRHGSTQSLQRNRHQKRQASLSAYLRGNINIDRGASLRQGLSMLKHIELSSGELDRISPPRPTQAETQMRRRSLALSHHRKPLRQGQEKQTHGYPTSTDPPEDKAPRPTSLPAGDARTYLIRRQKSESEQMARGKQVNKRLRTELLPLETVQEVYRISDLIQQLQVSISAILSWEEAASYFDKYISIGISEQSLDMSLGTDAVTGIERQLKTLLTASREGSCEGDIEIDLLSRMKGKISSA